MGMPHRIKKVGGLLKISWTSSLREAYSSSWVSCIFFDFLKKFEYFCGMNRPHYAIISNQNRYLFTSIGKKEITKIVLFTELRPNLYNLVLADYDALANTIDDNTISNNGDFVKVLTTVFHITKHFLETTENATILVEANTKLKQRLYNRIVRNNWIDIEPIYYLNGLSIQNIVEPLDPQKEYKAFSVTLKKQ